MKKSTAQVYMIRNKKTNEHVALGYNRKKRWSMFPSSAIKHSNHIIKPENEEDYEVEVYNMVMTDRMDLKGRSMRTQMQNESPRGILKFSRESLSVIKAKLYAQYLGQKVICGSVDDPKIETIFGVDLTAGTPDLRVDHGRFCPIDLAAIILKPISEITDEDKVYCYHRYSEHCKYDETQTNVSFLEAANHVIEKEGIYRLHFLETQSEYLRSKGYDLPNRLHLDGRTLYECGLCVYPNIDGKHGK